MGKQEDMLTHDWKSQQGYGHRRPWRGTTEARMWLAHFHMLERSHWPLWRVTLKRVGWEGYRCVTIRILQTLPQHPHSKYLYVVYSREAGMLIRWGFWLTGCPMPESSLHRNLMARWQHSPLFCHAVFSIEEKPTATPLQGLFLPLQTKWQPEMRAAEPRGFGCYFGSRSVSQFVVTPMLQRETSLWAHKPSPAVREAKEKGSLS